MREFSILIQSAPDVEGQWIAHCLNWDLVSQGNSLKHAMDMIFEAIVMAIEEDAKDGFDPADRPSATRVAWDRFASIQQGGTRVSAADVDKLPISKSASLAAVLYLTQVNVQTGAPFPVTKGLPGAPPPFMIAEFQNSNHSALG